MPSNAPLEQDTANDTGGVSPDDKLDTGDGSAPPAEQPLLTPKKVTAAVAFNQKRHRDRRWIRRYQEALELDRTGRWNRPTVKAIAEFQDRVMKRTPSGKVGPKTRQRLQLHLRRSHGWKKGFLLTDAERKDARQYNRELSLARKSIRHYKKVLRIKKGGRNSDAFIEKVARFQRRHKLNPSGKLGPGTRRRLREEYKKKFANPKRVFHKNTARGEGKVTNNFSWGEFHCNDGTKVPRSLRGNVIRLAQQLEVIKRAAGNKPVTINSGYRSPSYNAAIGGASNSMHTYGKAADIVISGMAPYRTQSLVRSLMARGKIVRGGMGSYGTFTHYDIGVHRFWTG